MALARYMRWSCALLSALVLIVIVMEYSIMLIPSASPHSTSSFGGLLQQSLALRPDAATGTCEALEREAESLLAEIARVNASNYELKRAFDDPDGTCRAEIKKKTDPLIPPLEKEILELDNCIRLRNCHEAAELWPFNMPVNDEKYLSFQLPDKPEYKDRGRVAIIVSITVEMVAEYAGHLSAIACYASKHKIFLHVDHFPLSTVDEIHRRQVRNLLKYLPFYQWVVGFDPMTRVQQYTSSILDFLNDSYDVILLKRGSEVTSTHIAFRSTEYSAKFLQDWITVGRKSANMTNAANGDLLELLLSRYFPEETKSMYRGEGDNWPAYKEFETKFEDLFFAKDLNTYQPMQVYRKGSFLDFESDVGMDGIFRFGQGADLSLEELLCDVNLP